MSTRTQYAGTFLLMPAALDWLATAQECFDGDFGCLRSGLLTSVFLLVLGVERVFHLDEMEDAGFARLCGSRRCPSRYAIGGWRRHLSWYEVDALCRRTFPWHLIRQRHSPMSFDEHTIPRWTRKYRIGKGYVTTRNKYMRCEKLFTGYDLESRRFVTARATPGNWGLQDLAVPLVQRVLQQGRPRSLHALFDAGAGKSDAGVRALWDLAEQHDHLEVTLRACRYPHRQRAWKRLPSGLFVSVEEPGVCVGAPAKELRLAETATVLKGERAEQAVRTIVCREGSPGPKKDRWHPLYTTRAADPLEVLTDYRGRQHQEQGYRVGVHDLGLDAIPCGYDKESPDRVRTVRRHFLNRPGQLYETSEALIVYLDPFAGQEALEPVVDALNRKQHRLPWLENRRLILSLTPRQQPRAGP